MVVDVERKAIKQKTVVQQVMEELKNLIASGQYKVHDKIPTENELAEMFGIARTSIREAIKIFNYMGILESQTGRGTFISDRTNINTEALTWSILLGQNNIYELIELREVLEHRGLQALLEKRTLDPESFRACLETLAGEIEHMREGVTQSSVDKVIEADYAFHGTIISQSKNKLFLDIYHTLKGFMHAEIKNIVSKLKSSEVIRYHTVIYDAIEEGNAGEALSAFTEHIRVVKDRLER
jgi:DNA-binding FadR family transcriptional regulator